MNSGLLKQGTNNSEDASYVNREFDDEYEGK